MSQEIPKTMKALVAHDKKATVQEIPVPEIDDDEVLVKVVALAQNPTDWKRTSETPTSPAASPLTTPAWFLARRHQVCQ